MKALSVDRRITGVVAVGIICLFASRPGLVESATAELIEVDRTTAGNGEAAAAQTCDNSALDLVASAENRTFLFQCPAGSELHPVEAKQQDLHRSLDSTALDRVYMLTADTRAAKTCGTELESLDKLVPGSTLKEVAQGQQGDRTNFRSKAHSGTHKGAVRESAVPGAGQQKVFNLTLGAAPSADTHFCYTCKAAAMGGRITRAAPCSIFVTVPKTTGPTPPGPGQNNDGHTEQHPGGETDQQTESGAFSPSLLNWLILSVAGCVPGLILRL